KKYPSQPAYEVDLGVVYTAAGNPESAKKQFEKIVSQVVPATVRPTAFAFGQRNLPEYVEKTYLQGRKLEKAPLAYSSELMQLYTIQRQNDKLMGEVLNLVIANPGQVVYA